MFQKTIHKISKIFILPSMIAALGINIYTANETNNALDDTNNKTLVSTLSSRKEPVHLKKETPISILLAGMDTGAMMYEDVENGRTDALIVATLNPKNEQTTLTSIPRDTWMPIDEEQTFDKINHAHVYGGIQQTQSAIEQYLGIPLDYYVRVDMKAFIEGIDEMGGLELTPNQTFEQNNSSFTENDRRLYSGEEIINYARMRKQDPNGDNGRQTRQRQIISEMMDQYLNTSSISKLPGMYQLYKENVSTNISIGQMIQMIMAYLPAFENIKSITFENYEDITRNGIYYQYIPEKERNTLHKALANNLEISENFIPIIYPLDQIKEQPYFETIDRNWDGIINQYDSPYPAGILSSTQD